MGCYWTCIEIRVSLLVAFVRCYSLIIAFLLTPLLLLYLQQYFVSMLLLYVFGEIS